MVLHRYLFLHKQVQKKPLNLFQSGKTTFVTQLLKKQNLAFKTPFDKIVWAYGIEQPEFFAELKQTFNKIRLVDGFPEEEILNNSLFQAGENGLLVLGMSSNGIAFDKTVIINFR